MKRHTSSWKVLLLPFLLLVAGEKLQSQTVGDYCIPNVGCYTTSEKAEAALRSQSSYAGIGQYLEHIETEYISPKLYFRYAVKNRSAMSLSTAVFRADLSLSGSGIYGCTPPPDDINIDPLDWCASEGSLVSGVQAELYRKWNSDTVTCTLTGTTVKSGYGQINVVGSSSSNRGTVTYVAKVMNTKATCSSGPNKDFDWKILQNKKIYCDNGFEPESVSNITEERLFTDTLCKPFNTATTTIIGLVKQCKSCAGSKNPIFPATGEKIRAEEDFVFAGRVFTRHYRSWRQARNSPYFGIGWTHTFSDKHDRNGQMVFSDTGDVESFKAILGNRYRGENSYDNILEYVNTGGVAYRLTVPGGEVKEFDGVGRLLRVKNLQDPSNDVTLTYSNNFLVSITDAKGRMLKFFYTKNMITQVLLPDGKSIRYEYDSKNNLTLVDYGLGDKRKYHYAESGLIGSADQVHNLTGISNIVGTTETRYANFSYDSQGRATSSTVFGSPNEVASVVYDSSSQATMTTESGAIQTYTMQSGAYRKISGMVTSGVSGDVTRTYDSNNRVMREIDRKNMITDFTYPTEYKKTITSAVDTPEENRREVDRNVNNLVTEVRVFDDTNVLQSKTSWTYNSRGQILTQTITNPIDNTVRTSSKTYCDSVSVPLGCPIVGLLKTETEFGSSAVTTYRQSDEASCASTPATCLYRKGDLWKLTNSLGHVTEVISYDGAGRVLSAKDENGIVTGIEYDGKGRQTAVRVKGTSGDRVTTMTYTSTDLLEQVNNPDGTFAKYKYDNADRLKSIEDNAGNKIVYTLNGDGKVIKEEIKDSSGTPKKTLAFTFNNLSQLTAIKNAEAQLGGAATASMTYDSEGNLETTTDGLSRQSRRELDTLRRIKKLTQDVTGLFPQVVNQKHDTLGKVTEVKDPKNLDTDYIHNGFGGLDQVDSPDSGSTGYLYNSLGQVIEKTNGNGVVEMYTYDVLGRLKTRNYQGDDIDETYTYDVSQSDCVSGEGHGIGRLTRVVDGSGSTNFCHNSYGDLVRKVQRTNGKTFTLRWVYGANGKLQEMIYPSGMIVDYGYNNLGEVEEIGVTTGSSRQVLLSGASYYPFGPIAGWVYGNDREMRRDHNLNYDPSLIQDLSSGGINYSYVYDRIGNLAELQAPGLLRVYRYDGLNRLKAMENSSGIKLWDYGYDSTGNRTSVTQATPNGSAYTYSTKNYSYDPANHRLTNDGLEFRNYDGAGNLVEISANGSGPGQFRLGLAHNQANRLNYVVKGVDGSSVSYLYNHSGERVQRSHSGGVSDYYVYNSTSLLGEYDNAGAAAKQIIWLEGMPVGVVTGSGSSAKLYYVESDGLGTPRVVIDPVRDVAVWKNPLESEPFGNSQPLTNPDGDAENFEFNLRFPGQMYDNFSGLVYNYFRDYDPTVGRYVQSDPIGLAGGISTYSYVIANPLTHRDTKGLQTSNVLRFPIERVRRTSTVVRQSPRALRIAGGGSRLLGPIGWLYMSGEAGLQIGGWIREKANTDELIGDWIESCKDDPCIKLTKAIEIATDRVEMGLIDFSKDVSDYGIVGEEEMPGIMALDYGYVLTDQAELKFLIKQADLNGCSVTIRQRKLYMQNPYDGWPAP
ncbi:MAG: RHS repeat-associated core domain-containing protein [Bdellovibrionota bacterium]